MKYSISQKAIEDLENIWEFTAENWSIEQADRYYFLIIDEIKYLSIHFEAGKSIDFIRKGYRSSIVKSHRIYYRKTKNNTVEIIRILHQNMDVEYRI